MAQKIKHGSIVSFQPEKRIGDGEYGVLDTDVSKPIMLWPGLVTSFNVGTEEQYEEISYTSAYDGISACDNMRNVHQIEDLPFELVVHPQVGGDWPLLKFITGSATGLGDQPDSTSWMKELNGKFSVYTGIMFEDLKVEIPERGVVKETYTGFAGHRAAVVGTSPAKTEASEDTSKPLIWNDITSIQMGGAPNTTETIAQCISDISFGFTSEVSKRVHPMSALTSKICGVRVVSRKMFVSLKLTWIDQTFLDIVTGSTKQFMVIVLNTKPIATILRIGGLLWPKYIEKAEPKELVGDTITCIMDQPFFSLQQTNHTQGAGNFAGPAGVIVTHNIGNSNYIPSIIPTIDGIGATGEVWVTDVALNSFVVHNSGYSRNAFAWVIHNNIAQQGTNTFEGRDGVTINHNLGIVDYTPSIVSIADSLGATGEVWVTDVALNSFVVRNSGSGITQFRWIVHDSNIDQGAGNFAGPAGVIVTHNIGNSNYIPSIIPTIDGIGATGEVWVTDVALNSFVVHNSGYSRNAFAWVIHN